MSTEPQPTPLVSKKGIVIDLALTTCFFLFMREVLVPHVPSQDPVAVTVVSSMTAFCMSGVFWLAAGMFRVTLVDYQRNKKAED